MRRKGYMCIKEAAVRYDVSRSKLNRLVHLGRLRTSRDPRDERLTLLRTEDLDEFFRFGLERVDDTMDDAETMYTVGSGGRLTAEWRARIDSLRIRASKGRRLRDDSVDIIREAREGRSRQVDRAASGAGRKGPGSPRA